jgi:hypothetical protein
MEELSKQLSIQLNEIICFEKVNNYSSLLIDKKNKINIDITVNSPRTIPSIESLISTYKVAIQLKNDINKDYLITMSNSDLYKNNTSNIKIEDDKNKIKFTIYNKEGILNTCDVIKSIYENSLKYKNSINKNNNDFNIELYYSFCKFSKLYIKKSVNIENINFTSSSYSGINEYIIIPKINEYLIIINKIKLKYGNNCLIKFNVLFSDKQSDSIEINNISNECIDLLDFIPYEKDKIICDGKIKELFTTNFHNIYINNCENLKKISNYISKNINKEDNSRNNIDLIIVNCPNIEFIEYNDKFNITIDNKKIFSMNSNEFVNIKKEIAEIKSLLKDQQEYAHIIQSLLKRINKLENKAVENE